MPKHNNVIANQHFHKKWQGGTNSMRGPIGVKTWYACPQKFLHGPPPVLSSLVP